ncbi:Hypothetical predicted protein [Mytilus galloprovincialis]|uniref:Ig-like domain-containing protein n=1 Tax=Mytilus galloprovincialis TaxID=29158 RepID=A0A8B6BX94_MYTGA|nr:Hypothetical predicted protein [Mytilus galloprovincialis]
MFASDAPDVIPTIQVPSGGIITGTSVTLTCTVSGGNPLVTLTWDCAGIKSNNTAGSTASYDVTFSVDKSYNNKVCTCSATHPVSSYRPSVQHILVVYYAPAVSPTIQAPSDGIITGTSVTLTCTVSGGNPLVTLTWDCAGIKSNNTAGSTASYDVTFSVDKSSNNKVCTCSATHPIMSYRPSVQHRLVVYYAPDVKPLIQQTPTGDILAGNEITLTCTVLGGNPLVTLFWNCTGIKSNKTAGTTASYDVTFAVDRSYNNKVCKCSATHPILSYRPSVQHRLVVYYAPAVSPTILAPSGGIITGTSVTLTCTVSGGNPLVVLTWDCAGIKSNNTAGTTASYDVTFDSDKSFNNKVCTCSATHPVSSYRPIAQHRLAVYFKPFLDTTSFNSPEEKATSENDNLFITVSVKSNPHPIIKWTFIAKDNIGGCNNTTINSTSMNVGLHTSSNISIDNLKKNQFGQYTFTASNVVGIFVRKFSVLGKVSNGEDMLALKEDNSGILSAGIASLVVGLLFFVAATILIFRKRFKKTYTKSYNANTYEECGNASNAAAYQNIENMKSGNELKIAYGHKKAEKNMGIYDNMNI